MEQETTENPQPHKEAIEQKVWETPTLETHQAAEGIQNSVALPAGDALVVGS